MARDPRPFELVSEFSPAGDQPQAIAELLEGVREGRNHQVLLGVTGSGKTFTMAQVIAAASRPALILAPNKTLAAQLYNEFRALFPKNAVEYFVSYYDYYQPEAYLPSSDTYIEKDAQINDEIDKLRHSATRSLLSRTDTIVVASVSCIYGLGAPEEYLQQMLLLHPGQRIERDAILARLVDIQYRRNDYDFHRGTFRVRGDVVEVFPSHEEDKAIRIEMFGDEIESIHLTDALRGTTQFKLDQAAIYPASHYVTEPETMHRAIQSIREELRERLQHFRAQDRLVEAQRLEQRTSLDLEMMQEMGFCKGIENYSRHLTGRQEGEAPPTLIDFFPKDFLVFLDESHVTLPQLQAMYRGDRQRKTTLVEYGFRLPSALDNRPLKFEEFQTRTHQIIHVSATPGDWELNAAAGVLVEQVIRPTGLLDPQIQVKPAVNQVDDLLGEVRERVKRKERVLATTLTKRMAEDLTEYFAENGVRVRYLHSDVETIERVEIIRGLRKGDFDLLVGINLLREGLDLPEVSLVAVLDADKEGFLRSHRSLIQTMGRAARNVNGTVILYADTITRSMRSAMDETDRRRAKQEAFNKEKGITPESVKRRINDVLESVYERDYGRLPMVTDTKEEYVPLDQLPEVIEGLEKQMRVAASEMRFEEAIHLRERIKRIKKASLEG